MKIPKKIHQIWIGYQRAPNKWMETWKQKNPDWDYKLWGNEELHNREWRCQDQIDYYLKECEKIKETGIFEGALTTKRGDTAHYFAWHVIADIMRYEILYDEGGFMPGADSICLRDIDDMFGDEELYIINTGHLYEDNYYHLKEKNNLSEHDKIRLVRYNPSNASPVTAAAKGNEFVGKLVEHISNLDDSELGEAVDTTGNVLMGKMINKHNPDARVIKFRGKEYRKYSEHYGGTTHGCYYKGREPEIKGEGDMDLIYPINSNKKSKILPLSVKTAKANLNFRQMYLVGGSHPEVNCRVIEKDDDSNPVENIKKKLQAVIDDDRISDNFILMNDDFLILQEYDEIPYYHKGKIKNFKPNGYWEDRIKVLEEKFPEGNLFTVHFPIVFNKEKLTKILNESQASIRTWYCNTYGIKGQKQKDYKLYRKSDLEDIENPPFLSTTSAVENNSYNELYKIVKENI